MDPQALIISRGKYAVRCGVAAVRVLVALSWLLLASPAPALTVQEAATLRAAPPLAESNKTADSLKRYQAASLLAHRLAARGGAPASLGTGYAAVSALPGRSSERPRGASRTRSQG